MDIFNMTDEELVKYIKKLDQSSRRFNHTSSSLY